MDCIVGRTAIYSARVLIHRLLWLVVALCALMIGLPAHAQVPSIFGRSTVGAIPSNGLSGDYKRASRFTVGTSGTSFALCAYLDGNGGVSGTQQVRLALYQDVNGAPGARLADVGLGVISSGSAARWYCQTHSYTPIAAGSYWIAIHSGGTTGVIRDFYDGGPNWYGNADTFSDGASDAFGPGNTGSGTLSVFARYYPDTEVRNAGRTTIGTVPSSGMTANFKRGSSILMTERGRLSAITGYLDGGGTGTFEDQQAYRYVIYDDANGVPGAKVYEGGNLYLRGGAAAQWRTFNIAPSGAPDLFPGRYWIVILTGSPGGVIRNFADGTGNWYGNSDAYADGASASFETGNPGNGTISAFVSYRPGTLDSATVGRTDVALTPSNGLTANYMRWSTATLLDAPGTLTSLHAYLDGLGGASGAQSLRMVLYKLRVDRDENRDEFGVYEKLAESAEVMIPAGMTPQWVSFPVSAIQITDDFPPVYLIGILSGATGGVARDNGDNVPPVGNGQWGGMPQAFGEPAVDEFLSDGPYSFSDVQLSVYARYSLDTP